MKFELSCGSDGCVVFDPGLRTIAWGGSSFDVELPSGTAFAIPTYAFIFAIFTMLIWAGVRMSRGDVLLAESADWVIKPEANFALVTSVPPGGETTIATTDARGNNAARSSRSVSNAKPSS